MAEELLNPDEVGKLLDSEVLPEDDSFIAPGSMVTLLDDAVTTGATQAASLATQNAMIQGKPTDIQAINLAAATQSGTASLTVAASQLYTKVDEQIAEVGASFSEIATEDAPGVLKQIVTAQEQVQESRNSPVSTELAVIKGSTTTTLDESVQRELALSLGAHNELSEMLDNTGLLDKVASVLGNFVPLRNGLDWSDLQEEIGEHSELKQYIDGTSLPSMLNSWQQLPIERREVLMKPLLDSILRAGGVNYEADTGFGANTKFGTSFKSAGIFKSDSNILNAIAMLTRFLQPEGADRATTERNILLGVDALSLLPFGAIGAGAKAANVSNAASSAAAGERIAKINKLTPIMKKNMEALLANAGEYLRRVNNPVKIVANAGDTKQAAQMNLMAMMDDDVARAYGLPTDVAYTNTMPMRASADVPDFVEGLTAHTAKAMNGYISKQAGFTRSMTSESELMTVGVIGESERAVVVRNFYTDMETKGEDLLQEGISLTDVRVLPESINEAGFTYEFVLQNNKQLEIATSGGVTNLTPKTHKAFRSWRVNDVTGNFEETGVFLSTPGRGSIPGQSPAAASVTKPGAELDFNDSVKQSLALDGIEATAKKNLNDNWLEANKGISGLRDAKARGRIEAVELAGDEYINKGSQISGKVYTERELIAGIKVNPTPAHPEGIVRLTKQNEIEAYYKRRLFADSLWGVQNHVTRRELQLAGFNRSATLKGQSLAVKPFESPIGAKMSSAQRPGRNVYLKDTDETTLLTDELIDAQYAQGRVLVRSHTDWNVTGAGDLAKGGEFVEYVFVEAKSLKNLPNQVLHYKNAYVPKINEGIEFVVKRKMPINKEGVKGATKDTALRAFSSQADAKLFIQQQIAKILAKKPDLDPADVALLFDVADGSKMAQLERMEGGLSGSGGLYTGTRSADELLMGLDGAPIQRMAPGEAFGRYIDHLGIAITRNEWRIGQEQQWINTVRKMDKDNVIEIKGFNGTQLPDTPQGDALRTMRDRINTWSRVPSREESLFEGMVQKYHDWALNNVRGLGVKKNAINHALWLKHFDPISAILTSNMHVVLGGLMPVQLYVQASAAVVALSLAPIKAIPRILGNTARFGMLDNIRNTKTFEKVIGMLQKDSQILKGEDEMYRGWRRSGLYDSVRSNADMTHLSSTGVGITNDLLRKGSNASLIVYRAGELTNRRVSFIAAYTRWKAANPKKVLNNTELLKVVQEANKTMLELGTSNKAWWQGGAGKSATQRIASVAGQFSQVLAKTVELAVKGEKSGGFSLAQKGRIAVGQTLMFGAAGMPLINVVAPGMMEWMGIKDDDGSIANAINQGMVGVTSKEVFGANIEVASRASLLGSTFETARDIVTSKDPAWTKVLGITNTTGQRLVDIVQEGNIILQSQAFTSLAELEPLLMHDRSGETEMSMPTMLETFTDVAALSLNMFSSTRAIMKARMMHNTGRIIDRRGNVTIDKSDKGGFSFADKAGVAIGFQLSEEVDVRMEQQSDRATTEAVQGASQVIVQAYHRYVYTHDMNPKYARSVTNVVQLMHESFDNPILIERITEQVRRKIFDDPKSTQERQMQKFFERTVPEKLTQGVMLDTSFSLGNVFNEKAIVKPFQDTLEQENK